MSKRKIARTLATPKAKRPSMEDLIEDRGTWSLDPEELQNMANAVVATVIRLAADANDRNDRVDIKVGDVYLGAVCSTTRFDYEELCEMVGEIPK